jgi:hypothetical protein
MGVHDESCPATFSAMTAVTATASPLEDALLDAYTLLEGEDSYSMGDPGGMRTTGETLSTLFVLLGSLGIDADASLPGADGHPNPYARGDRARQPVEAEHARLRALDQAAQDERWQQALAAIDDADRALTELDPAVSRAVVHRAASALNQLGHRDNTLDDIARNLVLISHLERAARELEPSEYTAILADYARELELNNQRYIVSNELEIGISVPVVYDYVGAEERRQGEALIKADFVRMQAEDDFPFETSVADWRLRPEVGG